MVTKTRTLPNGQTETYMEEEVYWTWDAIDRWSKCATRISFVGVEFDYGQISLPSAYHITTIKESSSIRYVYYGAPIETTGTLYARLADNTINESKFYNSWSIEQTHKHHTSSGGLVAFWIGWSFLIIICVCGFVYIDNHWLEDTCSRWR